jgi:hypothetical protein
MRTQRRTSPVQGLRCPRRLVQTGSLWGHGPQAYTRSASAPATIGQMGTMAQRCQREQNKGLAIAVDGRWKRVDWWHDRVLAP